MQFNASLQHTHTHIAVSHTPKKAERNGFWQNGVTRQQGLFTFTPAHSMYSWNQVMGTPESQMFGRVLERERNCRAIADINIRYVCFNNTMYSWMASLVEQKVWHGDSIWIHFVDICIVNVCLSTRNPEVLWENVSKCLFDVLKRWIFLSYWCGSDF